MLSLIWIGSIIATVIIADQRRLSVIGYFFLALFLGPLALVIVLILSALNTFGRTGKFVVPADPRAQLAELRAMLKTVEARVNQIEESLNRTHPLAPTGEEGSFAAEKPPKTESTREEGPAEEFEWVLGKYWLNRIGVVVFVIGIGLFINYSIQFLPAFAKISVGYALALSFLIWGSHLEKNERYKKISWGILGGGWGLMYLATYAMHYIEITRIIDSAAVELCLLTAVSFAAIIYNLRYRSWVATALTFLLAFITVGLGGVGNSTVIFWGMLVTSVSYIAIRQVWPKLLMFSIVAAFLTHHYLLAPQGWLLFWDIRHHVMPVDIFFISMGILTVTWGVFSLACFSLSNRKEGSRFLIHGHLWNTILYSFIGLKEIYSLRPNLNLPFDPRFWFLLAVACASFLLAYFYFKTKEKSFIVVNVALAFSLLAIAIAIACPRLSITYFWLIELVLLFVIGVYYKEFVYRTLGGILSLLVFFRILLVDFESYQEFSFLGLSFSHGVLVTTVTALLFFLIGAFVRRKFVIPSLYANELVLYSCYPILGSVLAVWLIGQEVTDRWMTLSWGGLGLVILASGILLNSKVFRVCALSVLALACLRLVFVDIAGVNTIYKIAAFTGLGVVFLGVSFIYSHVVAPAQHQD